VRAIGGDEVTTVTMVRPGDSPHTYEPKPSQMKALADASLYVAVGMEFEKVWLPKFRQLNPSMKVLRLDKRVTLLPMETHPHKEDAHDHKEGADPHIWTSPANMRRFAETIADAMCREDEAHCALYRRRSAELDANIDALDARIRKLLAPLPPHTAFMSIHPSWGYFAHRYGLRQLVAEVEGKAPKPRQLAALIETARQAGVRTIVTQPEFSDKSARILARQLHIPVLKLSPLDPAWQQTLLRLAEAIAKGRM